MNFSFYNVLRLAIIFVSFSNLFSLSAQCVGTNIEITICEKETDPNLQNFNLFDVLVGETPGGNWTANNNLNSLALNENTGILNLWLIKTSGIHSFTYANPSCDNNTATVSIVLGGYPGESNLNPEANNVCRGDNGGSVDLFTFIDSFNNGIKPDLNGIWTEDTGNPELGLVRDDMFIYSGKVPIDTFTFTYTTPSVGSCPERSISINVEVRKKPQAGIARDLSICETDDMSGLTNLDLFSRLEDEEGRGPRDLNGIWVDNNRLLTGEISGESDSEINVQNIYNNFGPGSYSFTYEVLPEHPICKKDIASFTLCIEKQLVLNGNVEVEECTGKVNLTYDPTLLDDGEYNIFYEVTGSRLGTFMTSAVVVLENGINRSDLFLDLRLTRSELLSIQIKDINIKGGNTCEPDQQLCTSIVNIPEKDFVLFVPPVTVASTNCEFDDVVIMFSGAEDDNFIPINGEIPVSYSINTIDFTSLVSFTNGEATLTLSPNLFEEDNVLVFFDSNPFIHCSIVENLSLNLIPAPPNPIFTINPNNRCEATSLEFNFDSPVDEFINYSSVTFDIYELGTEPSQFEERDPNASLSSNVISSGIDIDINDSNDVSGLPSGDYIFVIRSEQDDNAACRILSPTELADYEAQDIDIGLTKIGIRDIFDARLTFRVGIPVMTQLVRSSFEICLLSGPVSLGDLPIVSTNSADIILLNALGTELPNTYEITGNENFTAVFTNPITGCTMGTDDFTVTIIEEASKPVLRLNTFCNLTTPIVEDLDTAGQQITWYNSESNGIAYTPTEVIDNTKEYWAEITIAGSCVSVNRTRAEIIFIDKPVAPTPLVNEFCSNASPIINDLKVEALAGASLQFYTSETGAAYPSIALPLDIANEYWVTQTSISGCESDRVLVTFTIVNQAMPPVPLSNTFCITDEATLTLENLEFESNSIPRESEIFYFSDAAGTIPLAPTTLLNTLVSPVFVQQVVASSCFSIVVAVPFLLENRASKPNLSPVTFCSNNNPTIQNLINQLQEQTQSSIRLFEDETSITPLENDRELSTLTSAIFASQTILSGCESTDRERVIFTLETPTVTLNDFREVFCSSNLPTLNDAYLGNQNLVWFDQNNTPLPNTTALDNETIYFAQTSIGNCFSEILEVPISLVEVIAPLPNNTTANFCGIEEKTINDLLESDTSNLNFEVPENHNLLWYDSNDITNRNSLNTSTILEQGQTYYVVNEVSTNTKRGTLICESIPIAIRVNLTNCNENELIIPDAFSPNGDAINDTFELKNIHLVFPDYNIEIFNRYGRTVFKGNVETGFWDGSANQNGVLNNGILPTGVYFYVINFNRFNKKSLQGQVYLKR